MPRVSLSFEQVADAVEQLTAEEKNKLISRISDKFVEVEKFKRLSFSEKVEFIGKKLKEGFEKAGYKEKDIPKLIAEIRAERRKTKISA